jgi:hypothetical protein
MLKLMVLMSIFGTLLVFGCGNEPKSREGEKKIEAEKIERLAYLFEVQGTWEGPCTGGLDKHFPSKSTRVQMTFKDKKFFERREAFDSTDCSGEAIYYMRKTGTFDISEPRSKENPELPRKLDLRTTYVGLTPNSAQMVDQLNLAKTCGTTNWQYGSERPVSGRLCWGILAYPKTPVFTIFSLINNDEKICFGKLDETQTGHRQSLRATSIGTCFDKIQ